jgi:transposase-like protein
MGSEKQLLKGWNKNLSESGTPPPQEATLEIVEATPEIVEAYLRADPNLSPETAKALSELFRVAYNQFSGSKPKGKK